MTKVVLDVGNCGPDHASISRMLTKHFDVKILQADQLADTLAVLDSQPVDLVLVNRKLDIDYSDGMEIITSLKSNDRWQALPVMLVSNYAEHQAVAVSNGAELGFGKLELNSPPTLERLGRFLPPKSN